MDRYKIGSGTLNLIMSRYNAGGIPIEDLRMMAPEEVEALFYPQANLRRKDIPLPDFQYYYNRIHSSDSRVNISFCWLDYKEKNPDGYEKSQFYEYFDRFVEENYGGKQVSMAVNRNPGEKMYIDWVGDQPELLTDVETGEIKKVHLFATTLGVSSLIYAEAFPNEKLPCFIEGCTHAVSFYGAVAKYFVPDNLKTAVTKHTKDELVLQSTFADLEDFYGTIVLPPPARKPKGKPTVENHVRYLETHLVEKLKEKIYTSFEELNAEIKKIIAALNTRLFQNKTFSRKDAFEKYDKPCMKPLPGGCYTTCDYKAVLKVPNNYHIEYDGHYYSVLYSYCGKPAILKATPSEIRICDQYNRLICTHRRSYREFPLYITVDEHMPPEHLYYKEVNSKDGNYYRRWASVFGPSMSELIDRILKSSKHEEQAYNACAGILHRVKTIPKGTAEEAARKCIEINSCKYFTFKQMLKKMDAKEVPDSSPGMLPTHENIRGKDYYK
jgi:transposase